MLYIWLDIVVQEYYMCEWCVLKSRQAGMPIHFEIPANKSSAEKKHSYIWGNITFEKDWKIENALVFIVLSSSSSIGRSATSKEVGALNS